MMADTSQPWGTGRWPSDTGTTARDNCFSAVGVHHSHSPTEVSGFNGKACSSDGSSREKFLVPLALGVKS